MKDIEVFTHAFNYTVTELPKEGGFLFVQKGAPELMLNNAFNNRSKLLAERSLIINHKGQLGLIIGEVNKNIFTGQIEINNAARICICEKKQVFLPHKTRNVKICTIVGGVGGVKELIGATKVLVDDEVVITYP